MMSRTIRRALAIGALVGAGMARAVTPGQIDTFEDGTTMNWSMGSPAPSAVSNISGGGPGGVDDNFIRVIADGVGPGRRMTIFNSDPRWLGDYQAAGITAIRMDLRNLGTASLSMRIAFREGSTGTGALVAISSDPVVLSPGGPWTAALFPIAVGNLTFLNGATASALQSPIDLRLLHSDTASYPGPGIVATLGVDNIQAIPEPAIVAQFLAGGALVLAWIALRRRVLTS